MILWKDSLNSDGYQFSSKLNSLNTIKDHDIILMKWEKKQFKHLIEI
jgi:hypothetical protein